MTPTQLATLIYGAALHVLGLVAVVVLLALHIVSGPAWLALLGWLVGAPSGAALALIPPGPASAPLTPSTPAPVVAAPATPPAPWSAAQPPQGA